jgi:hypothetical protein
MSGAYIFFIGTIIALDIGAIMSVILEDLLYSKKTKILKIIFILAVPLIGALIEMWLIRKYKEDDVPTDNRTDDIFYTGGSV